MIINNKEIKGIIFDLDGTLLDSLDVWTKVDEKFFAKRGLILTKDYQDAIGHIGLDKAADYTIERYELNESKADIIKEWKEGVLKAYKEEVFLKPNVREFLLKLKSENIPFCIATANDEDCYKNALINNHVYEMFDFILNVNQFKKGKDSPDIFISALAKLDIPVENCAVFEDNLMAVRTANKVGFVTVGVYDISSSETDDLIKECDKFIYDFKELL